MNLHIARTAIEEGFHRIDISVLLHHDALEGDGRNLQVTGHLRVHYILAPGNALVRTAIHHLVMEGFLLRQSNFLSMESLEVWHLAFQLGELHLRIYLISQEDRLLLMHSLLVGRHLDEEVATRNITSSLAHTRFVIIVSAAIVHRRRTIGTASIARHSDLDRMRVQLSSIHHGVGSTNDERSILSGIERISDGNGGRRAGMSVDHLVTRLR